MHSMYCSNHFTLHRIHYVESMSCSSMSCNSMSCPIPVLYVEFDFLQFDLKSTNFEDPKKTSNKIRRIVFSVIDVIYRYCFLISLAENSKTTLEILGGWHSTEGAFGLLYEQPQFDSRQSKFLPSFKKLKFMFFNPIVGSIIITNFLLYFSNVSLNSSKLYLLSSTVKG